LLNKSIKLLKRSKTNNLCFHLRNLKKKSNPNYSEENKQKLKISEITYRKSKEKSIKPKAF
jgi:hypothetical protein